ncbi:LapA family protein [Gordonia caeni]|uniref:Lipopolysaccharide assembly protein A domain-containing protein n=1 Tax=Gordonia caeni TaxID=1007097 RepID=A0ABP7P487_9ACTN
MSTPEPSADQPSEPQATTPPVTDGLRERERRALSDTKREVGKVKHTRSRATYFAWVVGVVVAILLLVFILRNQDSQEIDLVFWKVNLPVGISLLIAALLGAILTLAVTAARIMELRRALRKVDKARKSAQK